MNYGFKVNEVKSVMEHVTPFDRFGLDNEEYQDWPQKLAENLGLEQSFATHDYTSQLEFHEQEVAEAPKRGMPEAQVNYHLGRIALIKEKFAPTPTETPLPSSPRGGSPEQHQLDCKKDEGNCSCGSSV